MSNRSNVSSDSDYLFTEIQVSRHVPVLPSSLLIYYTKFIPLCALCSCCCFHQGGDVSETIRRFFSSSDIVPPTSSSVLSLHDVSLHKNSSHLCPYVEVKLMCVSSSLLVLLVVSLVACAMFFFLLRLTSIWMTSLKSQKSVISSWY